jgi:hypothetical protein
MVQSQDVIDMPTTQPECANAPAGQTPSEAARRTLALRIAQRNRLRAERLARLRPGARAEARARPDPEPAPSPRPSPVVTGDPEAAPVADGTAAAAADLPEPETATTPEPGPEAAAAPAAGKTAAATTDEALADDLAEEVAEASAALEEFLQALTAATGPAPAMAEPAAVLRFQRPAGPSEPIGPPLPASSASLAPSRRGKHDAEPIAAPICDLHLLHGVGPGLIWALQRAGIACLAELAPLEAGTLADRLGPLGPLIPTESWITTARERAGAG